MSHSGATIGRYSTHDSRRRSVSAFECLVSEHRSEVCSAFAKPVRLAYVDALWCLETPQILASQVAAGATTFDPRSQRYRDYLPLPRPASRARTMAAGRS